MAQDSDPRLDELEARLSRVERQLGLSQSPPAAEPPTSPPEPIEARARAIDARAVTSTPDYVPPVETPRRNYLSLEQLLGGRLLLVVGAFVFLLGVAFFIKYAIDNNWIGITGRIVIGLIAGLLLLVASEPLRRRASVIFSEIIAGLGAAIIYFSLYAAGTIYHVVPISVSFVAMAVATAAVLGLAAIHRSERLAFLALFGGFITPLLNQTEHPNAIALQIYLAILNAGLLWLPRLNGWTRVAITALCATTAFVLVSQSDETRTTGLAFAVFFFVQFSIVPAVSVIRKRELSVLGAALVAINAAAAFTAVSLWLHDSRYELAVIAVGLAAVHLFSAQRSERTTRLFLGVIALAFATIGIAVAFSGASRIALWSLEGAALIYAGARTNRVTIIVCGYIALGLPVLFELADPVDTAGGPPFLNKRFITLLVMAGSFAVASIAEQRYRSRLGAVTAVITQVAANIFAVCAVTFELLDLHRGSELLVSLFWTAYAAALIAFGMLRRSSADRWQGFALFLITLAKVFLYDLSYLQAPLRIIAFLALGAILLAVAFLYQRRFRVT